jgi:N-acetylmuramoyl-L-alanine amidase
MDHANYFMLALTLWREARGEGSEGMLAVACVVRNRVLKNKSNYYAEVIKPWQFSSITAKGDPELALWPWVNDPSWGNAETIASGVIGGVLVDPTGGATLYWNPKGISSDVTFKLEDGSNVPFPKTWNPAHVKQSAVIGRHVFLREV